MDFNKADTLARKLLKQHGFGHIPIKYTRSTLEFGVAQFIRFLGKCEPHTLKLSKPMILVNSDDEVRDVILHEIAHFIAGNDAGHNYRWRQACVKIGARPEQYWNSRETVPAPTKYSLVCDKCGARNPRSRPLKKPLACGHCCKKYNRGHYTPAYNYRLETN